ncbi:hypothetical protein IT072_20680 (plasmid) [Leifsonia sp. ZF2019]|uniref:hypothetical protein n=1 Tax=Leifsonia sp. ZF2019 TaxID=2781978 RepID=UPI001CBE1446|nr:hypothetical protein [Leifsonia sp. ZF2019]UAJ81764.1 hypothetical protein IT072_20680 [Leifsonia sp. ZF2019]
MKFRRILIGAAAAVVIASGVIAGPANAAPPTKQVDVALDTSAGRDLALNFFNEQTRTFDYSAAINAGSDQAFARDFAEGVVLAGGTAQGIVVALTADQARAAATFQRDVRGCAGRDRFWQDKWGMHLEIDTCKVNRIIALWTAGSLGVAGLAGILGATGVAAPVALLAVIASAMLGLGAAAVSYCNAAGRGETLHVTGVPWCGGQ